MREDVKTVIRLAIEGHSIKEIADLSGVKLNTVLMILSNPQGAEKMLDRMEYSGTDYMQRKKLVHMIANLRLIRTCDRDPGCKYSRGIPCVGPVCWKEIFGGRKR